jgi:hypothetical protein
MSRLKPRVEWFNPLQADGHYVARIRALREADGCYAIREVYYLRRPRCVYVGQSSTGCLYRTLTRHFQEWSRTAAGSFWEKERGPCHVYDVTRCEVAIFPVPRAQVGALEKHLIAELDPRDNVKDAVPF